MPAGAIALTATGNLGPGLTATALPIANVRSMNFRFADGAVDVFDGDGKMTTFQYSALTTVTFTPASRTVLFS